MNRKGSLLRPLSGRAMLAGSLIAGAALLGGCQSDAQSGALIGAGLGALAGQAIGHNTEATLIGTAIGLGVGYAVGNESDKNKSRSRYDDDYGYERYDRYDSHHDRRYRDDPCDW
ncbi:MAG: glycine zipper 2TM domain-containing protein [Phycisphaerales bacterium]|nr:glycine zipper 2TM domain-containing protein [Phycisphaerales bacterium]